MNAITVSIIHQHTDARSFARGEEYYRNGAVLDVSRRGETIEAEVEGSEPDPYTVTVTIEPDGDIEAECTCPYEGEGWCKHVVAALLCCVHDLEAVVERPTLESLLAPLDRDALQTLILNLAHQTPGLANALEREVATLPSQATPRAPVPGAERQPAPPLAAPDLELMRRQIRSLLKSVGRGGRGDYWDDEGYAQLAEIDEGISPLIESADSFTVAGDVPTALTILEAVTEELLGGWDLVEDIVGSAEDLFGDLGRAWAEAILTGDLTADEREGWMDALIEWQEESESSGAESGLEVAVEAARQGWDYPPLVRVLHGEITDQGAWEGEPADCAEELAAVRLTLLERQGRLQEAAYLAEAEGQYERYLALLVRLGRAQEAVDSAIETLTRTDSAHTLAKTLHEAGETALAFRVADRGLELEGSKYDLSAWIRDTALTTGDTERAIKGATAAIVAQPRLSDYIQLQALAGDRWPSFRDEILAGLQQANRYTTDGKVDIFLHEGLMQDALNAVRDRHSYDLVARVVEAATPTLPLQVIPICAAQAEEIMNSGKADRYHHAARWLERARDAYRTAGQESDWQAYKTALLETHHRKYKLVPLLKAL